MFVFGLCILPIRGLGRNEIPKLHFLFVLLLSLIHHCGLVD